MCTDPACRLDFASLLADPLTQLVMDSDGISMDELVAVLQQVRTIREQQEPASVR